MAQREGSVYLYLFIGTFVLFLGAVVGIVIENAAKNDAQVLIGKLKKDLEDEKGRVKASDTKLHDLRALVAGEENANNWPENELFKKRLSDMTDFINARFKELDNRTPKNYSTFTGSGQTPDMITDLQDMIKKIYDTRKQAEEKQKRAEEEKLAQKAAAVEEKKKVEGDLAALKQDKQTAESTYEKRISDQTKEVERLQRELAQKGEQAATAEISFKREVAMKENMINSLRTRLDKLMEESRKIKTIDDVEPDGVVLDVSSTNIGWVDIGRRNHMRPGIDFQVFQNVKGGKRQYKGRVEIQQVEEGISRFRILETTDDLNPIAKGDFITSPFFDPKATPVFVFAGKGLESRKITEETLRAKIKGYGAEIKDAVDLNTSFVIALKDYDKDVEAQGLYKAARELGVPVLREKDILDFLGL